MTGQNKVKINSLLVVDSPSRLPGMLSFLRRSSSRNTLLSIREVGINFDAMVLSPLIKHKVLNGNRVLIVCPNMIKSVFKELLELDVSKSSKNFENKHLSIISYQKFYKDYDNIKGKFDYAIFHEKNFNGGKMNSKIIKFSNEEIDCQMLFTSFVNINGYQFM